MEKPVISTGHTIEINQIPTPRVSSSSDTSLHKIDKNYEQDLLLTKQGYKPELNRNFSFWSLLGVAFGLTNSWLGIAGSMGETFSSGGPLMVVWGLIAAFVFILPVAVTLSEMISMYPNSGGQYFWTFQLAPPKYARFWAFAAGNLGWLGSVFTCSSISLTTAQGLVACYQRTHDGYEEQAWHVVVCSTVLVLFVSLFNCWEKPLPYFTLASFIMSIFTFFIVMIVCLSVSHGQYRSAAFVFTEAINVDKDMLGITFLVSLTAPAWCLAGLDAAAHMAEELPNPAKTIPQAIIATVFIGFFTAFVFSVALFFCIKDVDSVIGSLLPLLEIIYQAVDYSIVGAVFLETMALVTAIFCNISANTWQARNCWSFSRDNGIIGSRYWKRVNQKTKLPVNAHLFSNFLCILIGLIYLGSSNAYTSVITASVEMLYFSYVIPTICLLKKGRKNVTAGPFWLGKWGLICNYLTCFWTFFCLIFFSFPYEMPATAGNMNYVSVVYAVCLLYIVLYWFAHGKKTFVALEDRLYDPGEVLLI